MASRMMWSKIGNLFIRFHFFSSYLVLLLSTLSKENPSLEGRIHLLSDKLVTVKLRWIFRRYNIIMRIYNRPLAKVSPCWIESFLACHSAFFPILVIHVKDILGTGKDSLVTLKYLSIGKSEGLNLWHAIYL